MTRRETSIVIPKPATLLVVVDELVYREAGPQADSPAIGGGPAGTPINRAVLPIVLIFAANPQRRMHRTRPLIVALIVAGTVAGVLEVRTVLGGRDRAQAAVLDAALRDASARDLDVRREAEAQVTAAAQLPPLNAALGSGVNGATLIDLFDNEDWWRPFRAEFPLVQIVMGDHLLASRGRTPVEALPIC